MKKILVLLFLCISFTFSYATPEIPKALHGYWESETTGMLLYRDGVSIIDLNLKQEWFSNFPNTNNCVLTDQRSSGDTLFLSFYLDFFKLEVNDIMILDDGEKGIRSGFKGQELGTYKRVELDLAKGAELFQLENTLATMQEFKYSKGTLLKVTEIPKEKQISVMSSSSFFGFKTHLSLFANQFNIGPDIYRFSEAYMKPDIYGESSFYFFIGEHVKTGDKVPISLIPSLEPGFLSLKIYSLKDFRQNQEPGRKVKPMDNTLNLIDLEDRFFQTFYSTEKLGGVVPEFWSAFELGENGQVHILGENWNLVRVYSYDYQEYLQNPKDNQEFAVYLELENPQTKQQELAHIFSSKGEWGVAINLSEDPAHFQPFSTLFGAFFVNIMVFISVLAISLFVSYRLFILPRKLKQRLTQTQLEGIKSQLNPHFLFNSMASIQSLMNQNKIEEANRYQSELSDLLRYHLDAGSEDMVLLSEELSALQHYLELENLRSPFAFSFEIDSGINPDTTEIPNQLLQPLVENAVKHGLRYTDAPKLLIRVQKKAKSMCMYILDNGPGIFAAEKLNEKLPTLRKTHKGLALIKEKMSILKKKGLKCSLLIQDCQKDLDKEESGTQVCVEFPLGY